MKSELKAPTEVSKGAPQKEQEILEQYVLPKPSLKPILIIFVCLFIFVVGGLTFMDLTSSTVNQQALIIKLPLGTISGNTLLTPIEQSQEPPPNVIGSLAFPKGTHLINQNVNLINQYNAKVNLATPNTNSGELFTVLTNFLKEYKWKIITDQIENSNDLLVASIAGSDGFYWTVGFTIPIVQSVSPSSSAKSTLKTTVTYQMNLFQQSDGG
jgi:hypothetical protein